MVERICALIDGGTYGPDAYTINARGESRLNNIHLGKAGVLTTGGTLQLLRNGTNQLLGQLTLAQMQVFDRFLIEFSKTPTTYRNIKYDQQWKNLYDFATRAVNYVDKDGTATTKMEETVPCRECGLILPIKLISVDHQKAKSGEALDPVFKIFRAIGYAEQHPGGHKGQQILAHFAADAGGATLQGSGKYELNAAGVIVFSIFRSSGWYQNLKDLSMHHLVNLRPVCAFCNSSLGDKL